jgi:hypothetical protein
MYTYASGQGHHDLADRLGIPVASSLAISGSANGRILRTTLKHSYTTNRPTFYVLGMTFLSRDELPLLKITNNFEGAWTNPQNQDHNMLWQPPWTAQDTDAYVELKLKWEWNTQIDRAEDLQYRMLSVINDLRSRGHGILIYNQADDTLDKWQDDPRLQLLGKTDSIIQSYRWRAIQYQHDHDVPSMDYGTQPGDVPDQIKHRIPGYHAVLNSYLADHVSRTALV